MGFIHGSSCVRPPIFISVSFSILEEKKGVKGKKQGKEMKIERRRTDTPMMNKIVRGSQIPFN